MLSETENETNIGGNYVALLSKKLGSGAFGEIYLGKHTKTNEEVAVKIEYAKCATPQLFYEFKILKTLQGGVGIPNVYQSTSINENRIVVLELLGSSLEDYMMKTKEKKFSLKTVLMIADQILSRIEFVHSKNIIHRDIKPENFLLGLKKKSHIVYLIDYGLAKKYRDNKTGVHIPYKDNKSLTGTARYASIYTHLGIEQSRRDDLEGLGYMLIYLLRGSLPWQGFKAKTKKEKYQSIMESKMSNRPEILCKDLPGKKVFILEEFTQYLNYVRELQFDEKPDYQYLKDLFKKLLYKHHLTNDFEFDWHVAEREENQNNPSSSLNTLTMDTLQFFSRLSIDQNMQGVDITNITNPSNPGNPGNNIGKTFGMKDAHIETDEKKI